MPSSPSAGASRQSPGRSEDRAAALQAGSRSGRVAEHDCRAAHRHHAAGLRRLGHSVRTEPHGLLGQASAFVQMPAQVPEPGQAPYQPQADLRITVRGDAPGNRRADVVELDVQSRQPRATLGTEQVTLGSFGQVEAGERVPSPRGLRFASRRELLERMFADGFEEAEARLVVWRGLGVW